MPNAKRKPPAKSRPASSTKKSPTPVRTNHRDRDGDFPAALAALLRSRKLAVPKGLEAAPPAAYANQPVSFVDQLAKHSDAELKLFAEKVAGYATRQSARAKAAWDSSPLIIELRRRKLKEPALPTRVVGVSVSLRTPLKEWTDAQILKAAKEWSKKGS
jgi:hypothetical protein